MSSARSRRSVWRFSPVGFAAIVLALLASGCISSRTTSTPPDASSPPIATPPTGTDRTPDRPTAAETPPRSPSDARRVAADLRASAARWNGVPHEWGGTSRRGVDCSGLVQALYDETFDMGLPRSTRRQARLGARVDAQRLQPGDLVFFRPEDRKRHVGVYLSDGEFVHASSSRGVMVSRLDEAYWQRHWWQARRVLPSLSDDGTPPTPSSPTRPNQRTGW